MQAEEFETMLRESAYLRRMLLELAQSSEQALAVVTAALARQGDVARLEADLLDLQQQAAIDEPNTTRDRILNSVRDMIRTPATG
jgi:hypothetical protein